MFCIISVGGNATPADIVTGNPPLFSLSIISGSFSGSKDLGHVFERMFGKSTFGQSRCQCYDCLEMVILPKNRDFV